MTKSIATPIVVPEAIRRKAGLRRGENVEFKVSGRAITIVPKEAPGEDFSLETVLRIIKEEQENPMTEAEGRALGRELQAYGAKQAKKLGIKEGDIVRIIHEHRARRRES